MKRRMQPKFLILLFFCLATYQNLHAQSAGNPALKRCPVKTLNYEQGLQNNSTVSIITDALGFTWVSTYTGMQRYNGYMLETVNPVVGKEKININSSVSFFELQNGSIWISYREGILEYNPYTNSFKKIISLPNPNKVNVLILPVKETKDGMWCLQYKTGLVFYFKDGIRHQQYSGADGFINNAFTFPEILTGKAYTSNDNNIFLYDGKNTIKKFDLQTHQSTFINTKTIYSFTCSNTHIFYISDSAIVTINISTKQIEKSIPVQKLIKENVSNGACFLNNENQLLLSLNSHLFEFDTSCNYKNEIVNLNRNAVVAQGFIKLIYADKFKRIWLLTNDDIKRIQNFDIPFEHFIYENDKNNFVRSMYYDEEKNVLLAGCYNGGIQLYDTSGNAFWPTALAAENVKDINVIQKLSPDHYLIETIGRGCYILKLPEKTITELIVKDSAKSAFNKRLINFVNNIQRINDSTFYIADMENVYKCVFKNAVLQSAQPLLPTGGNINEEQITACLYINNIEVWACTNNGKILIARNGSLFKTLSMPENYVIRSIAKDDENNIWIGTDKGLFVYKNYALIKEISTESGLLNDCIYALQPVDGKAAVFASSNLGLSYVSLDNKPINYTKESGLQENEFNTNSTVKTLKGKYFFGGVNGITSFYPTSLFYIADKPLLNITKFVINDSVANNYSDINNKNTINLKYDQNRIELDFAAAGLLNTNEYVYTYRLINLEKNWQTTHEPIGIKYVLQPGTYTFEINCHPIFSTNKNFSRSITIIIETPWWQTWWFRISAILAGFFVIAFFIFRYNRNKYQQQIRTLELQQKIQAERQRISRDLHDNLGAYAAAIAANVSIINKKENDDIFNQLKNNSQAIINQLNDTIWALNKEQVSLTAISDRFKVFIQKIQLNYPNIYISLNEEIHNDIMMLPANALHLFRIMQEAVNNALRHSNCKNLFIGILSNNNWQITIKDDGNGMSFVNNKGLQGNGLKNIKLRAAEAGWNVDWIKAIPSGTEVVISSTIN